MRPTAARLALAAVISLGATACAADLDDALVGDADDGTEQLESALAAAKPAPGGAAMGLDELESKLPKGIAIAKSVKGSAKVVFSVVAAQLEPGEKLLVRGDVTVSRCNEGDIAGKSNDSSSPCATKKLQADPYGYDPKMGVAVVLGHNSKATKGVVLQKWKLRACSKQEHHCQRSVATGVYEVPQGAKPTGFVNLVVGAAHGSARGHDLVDVEDGKGGLQVIRLGVGHSGVAEPLAHVTTPAIAQLPIFEDEDKPSVKRKIIASARLDDVREGDVLDVEGLAVFTRGNYGMTPLVGSQLVLSTSPDAIAASGNGVDAEITENSGTNCPPPSKGGCARRKTGAVVVKPGSPSTLYVNFVAYAVRNSAPPNGKLKLGVAKASLEVSRFRP